MDNLTSRWILVAVLALSASGCLAERASTAEMKAAAAAAKAADATLGVGLPGDGTAADGLTEDTLAEDADLAEAGGGETGEDVPSSEVADPALADAGLDTLADAQPDATVAADVDTAADGGAPDAIVADIQDAGNAAADGDANAPACAEGAPCNDGDSCTVADTCTKGKCAGTAKACGKLADACHSASCGAGGECVVVALASCDDGNPCTDDGCDATLGCQHANNGKPCSDGNVCTVVDACKAGVCLPGNVTGCDDGNACTDDVCNKLSGCKHTDNMGPCDDGDPCTKADACLAGSCHGAPACCASDGACDDGNFCTIDACISKFCLHSAKPDGAVCDDGSACTSPDACGSGSCQGKPAVKCDDGNSCTTDSCAAKTGTCVFLANTSGCDDGNGCTGADACAGGSCQGVVLGAGTPCDDGNKCTSFDACTAGSCAGKPIDAVATCDDGEACTQDVCSPSKGCMHLPHYFAVAYSADPAIGRAVVALPDGAVFATDASSKAALTRTDAGGNVVWQQQLGSLSSPSVVALVAVSDGYTVAGTAGSAMWLVHTDAAGNPLWEKKYPPTSDSSLTRGMIAVADGYALVGNQNSESQYSDARLLRTDLAGNTVWSKTFGKPMPYQEQFFAIAAAVDGFACVGSRGQNAVNDSYAGWFVRVDAAGNQLGEKSFDLATQPSGIAALAGGYAVVGTKSLAGKSDGWLMRIDAAGNPLWQQTYGGAGDDSLHSVAVLADGFALSGNTNSKGAGDWDGWLVRTDAAGAVQWQRTHGGAGGDVFTSQVAMPDGFLLVGGTQPSWLPWLVRTDLWGHASCKDAGCFPGSAQTCDDSLPCTTDACGGPQACTHTNLADGTACGSNLKCTAGVCK